MQSLFNVCQHRYCCLPYGCFASNLIATTNVYYVFNFRFCFREAFTYHRAGTFLLLLLLNISPNAWRSV